MKQCYLCGKYIQRKDESTKEHIVPRQFFPVDLRNQLNLATRATHRKCNESYQMDEDYFVVSLGPITMDTFSGSHLFRDISHKLKKPKSVALGVMVKNEYTNRTASGLYCPQSIVFKNFDVNRIHRVVWKIIKGLYFVDNQVFLSDSHLGIIRLYDSKQPQPDYAVELKNICINNPERGKYPNIFAYKTTRKKQDNTLMRFYGLLFWDRIMFNVMFHDVGCSCEECIKQIKPPTPHPHQSLPVQPW